MSSKFSLDMIMAVVEKLQRRVEVLEAKASVSKKRAESDEDPDCEEFDDEDLKTQTEKDIEHTQRELNTALKKNNSRDRVSELTNKMNSLKIKQREENAKKYSARAPPKNKFNIHENDSDDEDQTDQLIYDKIGYNPKHDRRQAK